MKVTQHRDPPSEEMVAGPQTSICTNFSNFNSMCSLEKLTRLCFSRMQLSYRNDPVPLAHEAHH